MTEEFSKLAQDVDDNDRGGVDEPDVLEEKGEEPNEGVQEEKERSGEADGVAQEGSLEER